MIEVSLEDLRNGSINRLTDGLGHALAETGAVCLTDQGHQSPVDLTVDGEFNDLARLSWASATENERLCWNDDDEATEYGAIGIAILLMRALTGLCFLSRAKKGKHFDYWLGASEAELPFQNATRLEVTGIRNGSDSAVNAKVKPRVDRLEQDPRFPAFVVAVEFGTPRSKVVAK